jgi:hypothetical protein
MFNVLEAGELRTTRLEDDAGERTVESGSQGRKRRCRQLMHQP